MKFNTDNLRKIPDDFPLEFKYTPTSPFILIKNSGEITFANEGKGGIVENYDEAGGDVLLFSWSGTWRTDVFIVTKENLKKFYINEKSENLRIQSEKSRLEQKEKRKLERKKAKK